MSVLEDNLAKFQMEKGRAVIKDFFLEGRAVIKDFFLEGRAVKNQLLLQFFLVSLKIFY